MKMPESPFNSVATTVEPTPAIFNKVQIVPQGSQVNSPTIKQHESQKRERPKSGTLPAGLDIKKRKESNQAPVTSGSRSGLEARREPHPAQTDDTSKERLPDKITIQIRRVR
jgi:hypothetical protein